MMLECWQNLDSCETWSNMHFPPGGQPTCIYGDPACPLRVNLQGAALTPQMEMFNDSMSSVRVSVEWLFGDILNYFKFLDLKKNLKIGLSSVGKTCCMCTPTKCSNLSLW